MQKKLAININEPAHDPMRYQELETAYQQMAQDDEREAEALAWSEATIRDGVTNVDLNGRYPPSASTQ